MSANEALAIDPRLTGPVVGPIDPELYRVGPGDVLQLNYSGRVSRSVLLPVGPEGTTFIPGWGLLRVGGLTLTEARREVDRRVARDLREVKLDIVLARVRFLKVYLTGDVRTPGPAELPATSRVSDALPAGAVIDGASRRTVRLRHRDGMSQIADLERFNRTGNSDANPFLRDGDLLFVPPAKEFVEVNGAVAHPGRYELGASDSLRTLLDLAGGLLPAARLEQALLIRWKTPDQADSLFFQLGNVAGEPNNPALSDGDRLYVYFTAKFHELEQASIFGEVKIPGTYPLVTGKTRLSDLVNSAGGFLERADLSTIHVFRATRAGSESDPELERLTRLSRTEMTGAEYEVMRTRLIQRRNEFRVDWTRLLQSPELDITLTGGDIVRVDPIVATVRVEGEVRRPGLVEYDASYSADQYVHLAGGYSNRAARSKVLITRAITAQTLRAHDVTVISPGDMIWVPERPEQTIWQNLQILITVAAQVATVVIAVRR